MSYQHKPGRGSMFINDRKETADHPDLTGSIVLPDGTECWLSGWKEKTQAGKFKLSVSVKPKESAPVREPAPAPIDDDIPF